MECFKDKVAIITGASSGIGRGTAIFFSKHGCKIVICGRNEAKLNETASLCNPNSQDNILKVLGDINSEDVRKNIVEKTVEKFGKISILINNSGISSAANLEVLTEDLYDQILNTNLRSVVFLTKLCLPYLIAEKGCIVNVSSVLGKIGWDVPLAYCISKSGLDQFTRCLALELAPKKVRVNSVNPGFVPTDIMINNGIVKSKEEDEQAWKDYGKLHPLQKTGTVEEIAAAIGFLTSDQAGFITGELLSIDGGLQLTSSLYNTQLIK